MMEQETSAAREYHEATKHRPGESTQRRLIDVELIPKQYKRYIGLPAMRLPSPGDPDGPLTLPALSALLHYSAGILRRRRINGQDVEFRAASCTGALYHIELYVVCGAVGDLRSGVYHYDAPAETLVSLRDGDYRAAIADAAGIEDSAPEAFVVMTATFWRNAWRYEERAYRHAFWDSGTIAANLLALADARGLAPRLSVGFIDDTVNHLLGVDDHREAATCIVAFGAGARHAATPEIDTLSESTEPLSKTEIEYPAIWRTHAATNLRHAPALRQWLDNAPDEARPKASAQTSAALERIIGRRGSARHFKDEPLTRPELGELMEAAIQPITADFPALTQAFAIVNDVEGLPVGTYRSDTQAQRLQRLQRGNFREAAAHLALEQPAAGEAALNVYFIAHLDDVLTTQGERGYRAAQLEAGLRGGRVYLKATALGLRATGLTFYDDEVAKLFGEPEDAAVLFLIVVGR
ncbi:MAG TPA: SagB/ThcOx family dehydrogenase [Dehalococcoidia bacterium]|nr:SagB/ThcOx family dehydrogenase [Dehalococcoidia bacterium]